MPALVLGPLLRYVGETQATVWVETDAACEVEILGHRARTFAVEGHHYALVVVEGLEPGSTHAYEVALDGQRRWPEDGSPWPASVIRTLRRDGPVKLAFGSCRVAAPNEPPYTLTKDQDPSGREIDALDAMVRRMRALPQEEWPHVLMLLGDQVYADECSPATKAFIRSRRDPAVPPGEQVADFEEFTQLYRESWTDPSLRWLLSTVSTSTIFDDHDVHDDWNTSRAWIEEMRAQAWWDERIIGALASYWVYQHLGNLSPEALEEDTLWQRVREVDDAGPLLREFAFRADREVEGSRWSYCRDLAGARLIVMDSRAGRVLGDNEERRMVDDDEWRWIVEHSTGDFDHLLLATSLPVLLAPGMHYLEAWNEKVCAGAWGGLAARAGEKLRQGLDLEHWAAFEHSFRLMTDLVAEVGSGRRGSPPATISFLSGDVHHAYLAEVAFRRDAGVRSSVYQAVCSPIRNPLDAHEKRAIRLMASPAGRVVARALARAAGVPDPDIRWRRAGNEIYFDNQIATLDLDGREATMRVEKALPGGTDGSQLEEVFARRLA
jgi:hypothetical protein